MRMQNKVVQRPLLVTRKATAPSVVMGTGLYKRGAWFLRYGITFA